MPRKLSTYKKRSSKKAKPGKMRRSSDAAQARAMTSYIPFFRRINAPRQFVKLACGFQGFVIAQAVTGGYFSISPAQFETPFDGAFLFSSASNGFGQVTGNTSLAGNYAGYTMLTQQYQAYRVHSRRLTVTAMPSLAGDQIQLAIVPSNQASPPAQNTWSSYIGNSRGKTRMIAYGGEPGTLTYKHKLCEVVGLTRAQWDAQPPTRVGATPANVLFCQDYILWDTVDGGSIQGNIVFSVMIEAEIELSEAVTQSG